MRALLKEGEFIEVFVKADVDTCKKRDPKGLYEKALRGEIERVHLGCQRLTKSP